MDHGRELVVPGYLAHLNFETYTPTGTTLYIGTCKQCKTCVRFESQQSAKLRTERHISGNIHVVATYERACTIPGARYDTVLKAWLVTCPTCGPDVYWRIACKSLKKTYNAAVKCTSKCTNAKRGDCECSCGGEHHGKAHHIG